MERRFNASFMCWKYAKKIGISLNPKKSIFGVTEGKLLGYIISKYGTCIDPKWLVTIKKLPLPISRK